MQNKINIGIIGKNFGYHVIYKALLKCKEFKVKGFSFKSKVNKISIPKNIKIYSNWKKLILDKKIDAIAISTPPVLHKNIIKFAIKNNKHIFCEKPFTTSYKDANSICNIIKKNKKISHIVNYEFANINAFVFFKKTIVKNIKIKRIYLDWFINLNKRSSDSWKESHSKGGGILFNYICHSIYYLEFLFGKILSVKTTLHFNKSKNQKNLKGFIFFKSGLSAKLNIQTGSLKETKLPTHQIKILTDDKDYILKTNLNSLTDKFNLITLNKNYKKTKKDLYKNVKNKSDFRIAPTYKNLKKFSNCILKQVIKSPNFFDGKRIHLVIKKIILSSKKNTEIYLR